MSEHLGFATPQAAEDAFYDALEAGDLSAMMAVWADSAASCCLLPMLPLAVGAPQIERLWQTLFAHGHGFALQIAHRLWIEQDDYAVHLVEEQPLADPQPPPLYALHVFQRTDTGWRVLVHQNSPTPPPAPLWIGSGQTALA